MTEWYEQNLVKENIFRRFQKQFYSDLKQLWIAYKNGELGGEGGYGTMNHAELNNLSYSSSGHTGFATSTHTHNDYETKSNKNTANGYAPLDSNSKVPTVNLGGSGADNTKYLRGDQTWQVVSGGSGLTHPQVLARGMGC